MPWKINAFIYANHEHCLFNMNLAAKIFKKIPLEVSVQKPVHKQLSHKIRVTSQNSQENICAGISFCK